MKTILSLILACVFINSSFGQDENQVLEIDALTAKKENCIEKEVILKSKNIVKYKHILFWKNHIKKVKRVDQAIGKDGKVIREVIMQSIESGDEYLFKKFKRLVIIGNEIHESYANFKTEKGFVMIYNFCGELVRKKIMSSNEIFERYNFNAIRILEN